MADSHADTDDARRKEVKVEDLLRLKRAERPDATFWHNFDRELHQRMLQTLVKKDPWYIQLLRGVSGRIAQTTAVGAAAAFLALMVLRPVFVNTVASSNGSDAPKLAQQLSRQIEDSAANPRVNRVVAPSNMADFDGDMTHDYRMEGIQSIIANRGSEVLGYTAEYTHDTLEVAMYDSSAYVVDTASFAGSGLATGLVY